MLFCAWKKNCSTLQVGVRAAGDAEGWPGGEVAGDPADQALQGEPTGPGGHPAHQPQPGVRRPRQDQQAEGGIPSQVYVRGGGGAGVK